MTSKNSKLSLCQLHVATWAHKCLRHEIATGEDIREGYCGCYLVMQVCGAGYCYNEIGELVAC